MRRATIFFPRAVACILLAPALAGAMGFGRTVTATTLGQPLDFSARVLLEADETLARECVAAEVFAGDARVSPANVRVDLEGSGDTRSLAIRVATTTFIDEPVVTINISMGCGSRISRRFVAFIDPPVLRLADAARTETIEPPHDAQERLAVGQQDIDGPARRSSADVRERRVADAAAHRPRRARQGRRTTLAATAPERSASAGPRLQLDGPRITAPVAQAPASAVASGAPPVAAAPATPEAAPIGPTADALALERERIRILEAGLAQLTRESKEGQKSMALLQARLREAEDSRYANGFVYVLAGLVAFFALLAAAFWAVRPRQRRRAVWLDAAAKQAQTRSSASAGAPNASASAATAAAVAAEPKRKTSTHGFLAPTAPASIGGLEVTTVLGPSASRAAVAAGGAPAAARRSDSLSMEELIDLEQQAEFFVVLGQDEAAIDLLATHLRSENSVSPLPYLQLLEIHQRRGDQPAYERVRASFKDRFAAFAPEWSSDLHFGRALESYAPTVARLQALWATPMHAMRVLDGLLFRRKEGEDTFDFPAYRDLLFLYSIARELAGQVDTDFGSIDLFLPLDEPADATRPMAEPSLAHSVDFDVSSWQQDVEAEDIVIRRSANGAR